MTTEIYIQTAAALIFVILLIFAMSFVLRKKNDRFGLMSVVGYHSFGPKKGVAALKIGKDILILGVSPSDMRLLKTVKESDVDLSKNEEFQSKLNRFIKTGFRRNGQ